MCRSFYHVLDDQQLWFPSLLMPFALLGECGFQLLSQKEILYELNFPVLIQFITVLNSEPSISTLVTSARLKASFINKLLKENQKLLP